MQHKTDKKRKGFFPGGDTKARSIDYQKKKKKKKG